MEHINDILGRVLNQIDTKFNEGATVNDCKHTSKPLSDFMVLNRGTKYEALVVVKSCPDCGLCLTQLNCYASPGKQSYLRMADD